VYKRITGWDHAFAIPGCGTDEQIAEALRMTDEFLTGLGYLHGKATIIASRPSAEPVQPQGERVR
jgi:hypothetical protein